MLACAKTLNFTGDVVKFRCNHVWYSKGMKSSHRQSTPWWQDKRIVQGDNIHNFIKIHEWDIVNIIYLRKLPWNQPWFENAQKLLFEIKVDFKDDLKSRLKFMSWLEILGCFQNEPESLFLSLLMQFCCLWKIYLCLLTQNCTHNHVVTFTNTLRHLIKIYDRLNFRQASRSSRLVNLGNSLP